MTQPSKIDDPRHDAAASPAYHLGYADGLAGVHLYDDRDDYQRGHRDGCTALNAPDQFDEDPSQLQRRIDDHRMAALRIRVENLGLNPDEIIELDLTPNAIPKTKYGKPKTSIDRSSVGYGRGAA
jgi:hypothetical protein